MTGALELGEEVPTTYVTADECSMMLVTLLTGDPNPIHFDTDATARLGLGDRPVNQGVVTMAYPVNAVLQWLGPDWRVGRVRVRFHGNVVAGDQVVVGGSVVELEGGADPSVTIEVWVRLASGDVVLDGEVVMRGRG